MPKIDVIDELKQRFLQPLSDFRVRRVVIWRDADGEFAERFEELSREGFDGVGTADGVMPAGGDFARPVRFMEARDGVMFEAKRMIARGDTASDILLYRPRARGSVEGDWLADVELYADHFQADYLSLLADQLGATKPRCRARGAGRAQGILLGQRPCAQVLGVHACPRNKRGHRAWYARGDLWWRVSKRRFGELCPARHLHGPFARRPRGACPPARPL